MSAITKSSLGKSMINGIYNEFISKTGIYYYYLGKIIPWDPELDSPETPIDTYAYEVDSRNQIVTVKKISASDLCYVVRRINWSEGTVYDMYDDRITSANPSSTGAASLEDSNFYVITDEFNVYKCIFNSNGAVSTEKPIGSDSSSQTYSDGYVWKYMYNIPVSLRNKFLTDAYMPVTEALNNQFYSSGEVLTLTIVNGGSGYTTATVAVSGDGYIEDNPRAITGLTITDGGAGYVSAPAITITSPTVISGNEIQATATCTISGGIVNTTTLTENGYGYESGVSVSIAPPFSGTQFTVSTAYTNGSYLFNNNVYYQVVGSGTSGTTLPTHTSGTVASGAISLTYVGKRAVVALTSTKTNASVSAVLDSGEIVGYVVNDGGIGYTFANVTVTGNGTGAELTVNLSVGDVDTLQANVELQAVNGALESIQVTNGGSGYSNATITITGDGTGAVGVATISSGAIEKITMSNVGSGYTWAEIAISGSGTGAVARAIISPFGGHGKNAISELFTKKLMFYSSIFNEKNHGFAITNDYRQTGIIKQLNKYDSSVKFRSSNGTACFKVFGTINPANFPQDSIVYQANNNRQFNVVEVSSTAILLQSIENQVPESGLVYRNSNMDTFTATTVVPPSVDKFSGDLLYIDNRTGFESTSAQAVTFRTIIGF